MVPAESSICAMLMPPPGGRAGKTVRPARPVHARPRTGRSARRDRTRRRSRSRRWPSAPCAGAGKRLPGRPATAVLSSGYLRSGGDVYRQAHRGTGPRVVTETGEIWLSVQAGGQLDPAVNAELDVDVPQVGFHRVDRQEQLRGDLPVGLPGPG